MRLRYRAAVALAGAALFAGSAYAVVTSDAFVRRMVRSLLARVVRGPAHIEGASFSFREGLVVRGLEVRDPDDPAGDASVQVETLRADYGLFVLGEGPRITDVLLENPRVRVRRLADGTLSVGSLLEIPESDGPSATPPVVRISGGTLAFDDPDLAAGGPLVLEGMDARMDPTGDAWRIKLTGTAPELGAVVALAFVTAGGELTAQADLSAVPLAPATFERLRFPGAGVVAQSGLTGTVSAHVEAAFGPGHDLLLRARLGLAGLVASAQLPGAADVPPPQSFEVRCTAGRAEFADDAVVLTGLALEALGASVQCDEARLDGLSLPEGPSLRGQVTLDGLRLGPALRPYLPTSITDVLDAFGFEFDVRSTVDVAGLLSAPSLRIEADVANGRVRYEGYPREDGVRQGFAYDVDDAAGHVVFDGRDVRFTAGGRHGPATIQADGVLAYGTGDEIPRITILAHDVPLDDDLRAAFQDRADQVFDRWGPSGMAESIEVRVLRDPHADGPSGGATEVSIELGGRAQMRPLLLPVDLEDLRGRIDVLAPVRGDHRAERVRLTDIRAHSAGLTVHVDGYVDTDREVASDDLTVTADVEDLAGPVREALLASTEFIPESVKRLVVDLGGAGPAKITAAIAGDPDRRRDLVTIDLAGASVTGYRDVPFAAQGIVGRVVVDGDEVRLSGIRARALGVDVTGEGRLLLGAGGTVEPDVRITAKNLPLGAPLRHALGPLAEPAAVFWDQMRPVGDVDTAGSRADTVVVLRPSTDPTPVELWLSEIRGPLRPLDLEFDNRGGELHYDGRTATLRLSASIGAADVDLQSAVLDLASGRIEVAADVRGLRFPEDIEGILAPETTARIAEIIPGRNVHWNGLRAVFDPREDRLDLSGDVSIRPRTRRAAPAPGLAPDGSVQFTSLTFRFPDGAPVTFDARGRAAGFKLTPGLRVEEFTGDIALTGSVDEGGFSLTTGTTGARLVVEGVVLTDAAIETATAAGTTRVTASAAWNGGRLTARFGPGAKKVAYRGELHLRGADLAQIAGASSGVSGAVDGDVTFRSVTGETKDLEGTLDATVKNGDLVKIPIASAVLNVIPGAGNLNEASVRGTLSGTTIKVKDAVISGPILKIYDGQGTVTFDGKLDLDLWAFWGVPFASLPVHVGGTLRNPAVGVLGSPTTPDRPDAPDPRGDVGKPVTPSW